MWRIHEWETIMCEFGFFFLPVDDFSTRDIVPTVNFKNSFLCEILSSYGGERSIFFFFKILSNFHNKWHVENGNIYEITVSFTFNGFVVLQ